MDAFEAIVATILEYDGYWVRPNLKISNLSKGHKERLAKPSLPRPEVDVVAYKAAPNELLVVECKSYLDSGGVRHCFFDGSDNKYARLYKIFNDEDLRSLVLRRVVEQLVAAGTIRQEPRVRLCLVAGRIYSEKDRALLTRHFSDR